MESHSETPECNPVIARHAAAIYVAEQYESVVDPIVVVELAKEVERLQKIVDSYRRY